MVMERGAQRYKKHKQLKKVTYRDKYIVFKNLPRYWRGKGDNWDPPIIQHCEETKACNVILSRTGGATRQTSDTHED